jgi:hypothetical protein
LPWADLFRPLRGKIAKAQVQKLAHQVGMGTTLLERVQPNREALLERDSAEEGYYFDKHHGPESDCDDGLQELWWMLVERFPTVMSTSPEKRE